MITLPSRLAARAEISGDCWVWTGHLDRDGYGRLRDGAVHRLAWMAANGPIPCGLTVDHLCFVRTCMNPAHLRLLTHRDNARNQRSARKTHCKHGHEFTPQNTIVRKGDGRRDCRRCLNDRVARYRAKAA